MTEENHRIWGAGVDLSSLDYHGVERYAETLSEIHAQADDCPAIEYGTICRRSSLIRQSCHYERDFDHVLLQLVDILNTRFKYREGSWHLSLKRWNCRRKSCVFDITEHLIIVRCFCNKAPDLVVVNA